MFKDFLKITLRKFRKEKVFIITNLLGFSISLSVAILIFLFVKNEYTFDNFHKNSDQIFRVTQSWENHKYCRISNICGEKLKYEIPEFVETSRYLESDCLVSIDDNKFNERIGFVDPSFAKIFSFPTLIGNAEKILQDKSSAIISNELAKKYFYNENPIDKILTIQIDKDVYEFIIKGIIKTIPSNSSLNFSILLSYSNYMGTKEMKFLSSIVMEPVKSPCFFVKLNNPQKKQFIESKINNVLKGLFTKEVLKNNSFSLQPLNSIHFNQEFEYEMLSTTDVKNSYIMIVLALLMLILASANYVNLSIAQSSHRFKEIGIHKILGGSKKNIIIRFLVESILLTFISLLIAVVISEYLLYTVNDIFNIKLEFNYVSDFSIFFYLFLLAFIVGLLAGSYPSFYLANINPTDLIKLKSKFGGSNLFTKILVISQFVISNFLIICAIVISEQNVLLNHKDLGFDPNNIIVIKGSTKDKNIFLEFKRQLSGLSIIKNVTISSDLPAKTPDGGIFVRCNDAMIPLYSFSADYDYLNTLNIKLLEGRWFSKEYPGDINKGVIVNKAFIKELNLKMPAEDKVLYIADDPEPIIGVINDFNYLDLKHNIEPAIFRLNRGGIGLNLYIFIKLKSNNHNYSMNIINKSIKNISPTRLWEPFELDNYITQQYFQEKKWNMIISHLSIFTIILACLGLFGLVKYNTEKRIREISIRKVFGASINNILIRLSKELLLLITIANIISLPIAYLITSYWLRQFAYRINVSIDIYIITGFVVYLISGITISLQVIKTASKNPIDSLRYE